MDLRIGVTHSPRELALELADDTDRGALQTQIDEAVASETGVLWLTDRKGGRVGVPASKIGYVEIGADDDHRIGFGST